MIITLYDFYLCIEMDGCRKSCAQVTWHFFFVAKCALVTWHAPIRKAFRYIPFLFLDHIGWLYTLVFSNTNPCPSPLFSALFTVFYYKWGWGIKSFFFFFFFLVKNQIVSLNHSVFGSSPSTGVWRETWVWLDTIVNWGCIFLGTFQSKFVASLSVKAIVLDHLIQE